MRKPSTELCPRAIPFGSVPPAVRGSIANYLRLENDPALERYCANEANILAAILAMSVEAILALEVLVDAGGELRESHLRMELMGRHDWDEVETDRALARFQESGWFVLSTTSSDPFHVLLRPAAEIVGRLVRGISLPDPPPASARGTRRPSSLIALHRQTIALVAATAHDDLRLTANGSPHQASLKKLSKRIGVDAVEAETLYHRASTLALLRTRGRMLAPDVDRLTAFARRQSPHDVDDWIDEGWLSRAAIERAMFRTNFVSEVGHFSLGPSLLDSLDLETIEHEGQPFVRRPRETRTGDGHVTPSFDVMLGPNADLETVAAVGLFAELMRFDRVISYRLTRRSVANATALGVTVESILATLALVGPHGVPENVAATIRDFGENARAGELVFGWHLVVPPGTKLPSLDPTLATPVGDGAYLLSPSLPFADLEEALRNARVALRPGSTVSEAARTIGTRSTLGQPERSSDRARERSEPPLPLVPGGHPELRRRVRENKTTPSTARATAPPKRERKAAPSRPKPAVPPAAGPFARMLAFAQEEGFADEDVDALAALASLELGALRELSDFAERTDGPDADLTVDPVGLMSFSVLEPRWKKKLMRRASDLDELLELAIDQCKPSHLSLQGRKVRRVLRDDDFHALLEELIDVLADGTDDTPELEPPSGHAHGPGPTVPGLRALPALRAAPASSTVAARVLPDWAAIPKLDTDELVAFLLTHVDTEDVIAVALSESHDPRVRVVKAATLQKRGDELALFAVDVVTDEARVLHVRDVVGATLVVPS